VRLRLSPLWPGGFQLSKKVGRQTEKTPVENPLLPVIDWRATSSYMGLQSSLAYTVYSAGYQLFYKTAHQRR